MILPYVTWYTFQCLHFIKKRRACFIAGRWFDNCNVLKSMGYDFSRISASQLRVTFRCPLQNSFGSSGRPWIVAGPVQRSPIQNHGAPGPGVPDGGGGNFCVVRYFLLVGKIRLRKVADNSHFKLLNAVKWRSKYFRLWFWTCCLAEIRLQICGKSGMFQNSTTVPMFRLQTSCNWCLVGSLVDARSSWNSTFWLGFPIATFINFTRMD